MILGPPMDLCCPEYHLDGGVPLLGARGFVHGVVKPWWDVFLRGHHNSSVFSFFQFGSFFGRAFISPPDLDRVGRIQDRQTHSVKAEIESNRSRAGTLLAADGLRRARLPWVANRCAVCDICDTTCTAHPHLDLMVQFAVTRR